MRINRTAQLLCTSFRDALALANDVATRTGRRQQIRRQSWFWVVSEAGR